ncbi:NAD(P)H-dependent oxidoreductase [Sagittula sp. NFXS13]|uniref:FMN dependent NADH:quinone oxidoreductase n=1 Tax=Sagittula marina TaxID=943940 RepID=A0A7W6DS23_9RHOB|nr:NAD(P)H-dependent oxidoreductase [Sagittula marina]MBB3984104.1 FMN-dependent NADH-azoreductase [Sagittula marina]
MTETLLRIDTSARHEGSVTRELGDRIEAKLNAGKIIRRDLADQVIPQLDAGWLHAAFTSDEERTTEQRDHLALSDRLIAEIQEADTLLLTVPVYNFNVPASLKSWVDMIARAGITFRYTESGAVGLLDGKRAILAIASGGTEVDSAIDHATPWLRQVLNFVGITDIQVVRSDKQAVDPEASKARAETDLENLAA